MAGGAAGVMIVSSFFFDSRKGMIISGIVLLLSLATHICGYSSMALKTIWVLMPEILGS